MKTNRYNLPARVAEILASPHPDLVERPDLEQIVKLYPTPSEKRHLADYAIQLEARLEKDVQAITLAAFKAGVAESYATQVTDRMRELERLEQIALEMRNLLGPAREETVHEWADRLAPPEKPEERE